MVSQVTDGILRPLPLRDVVKGSHHPDGLATVITSDFSLLMNDALSAIGQDYAVVNAEAFPFVQSRIDGLVYGLPVIGMHGIDERLIGGAEFLRGETKDAIDLV